MINPKKAYIIQNTLTLFCRYCMHNHDYMSGHYYPTPDCSPMEPCWAAWWTSLYPTDHGKQWLYCTPSEMNTSQTRDGIAINNCFARIMELEWCIDELVRMTGCMHNTCGYSKGRQGDYVQYRLLLYRWRRDNCSRAHGMHVIMYRLSFMYFKNTLIKCM